MFYTYVLKCGDGHLYVGSAANLRKRIAQHRAGQAKSISGHRYCIASRERNLTPPRASPTLKRVIRFEESQIRIKSKQAVARRPTHKLPVKKTSNRTWGERGQFAIVYSVRIQGCRGYSSFQGDENLLP